MHADCFYMLKYFLRQPCFFCRFPVIVCSVYAVLCNMKYVGTHVFLLPFLSKNRMPLMLLRLPLSGSCPCLCMVVFLRFVHAYSCMQ